MPTLLVLLAATATDSARALYAWFKDAAPPIGLAIMAANFAWKKMPARRRAWFELHTPWFANLMRASCAFFADLVKTRAAVTAALRNEPWRDVAEDETDPPRRGRRARSRPTVTPPASPPADPEVR